MIKVVTIRDWVINAKISLYNPISQRKMTSFINRKFIQSINCYKLCKLRWRYSIFRFWCSLLRHFKQNTYVEDNLKDMIFIAIAYVICFYSLKVVIYILELLYYTCKWLCAFDGYNELLIQVSSSLRQNILKYVSNIVCFRLQTI